MTINGRVSTCCNVFTATNDHQSIALEAIVAGFKRYTSGQCPYCDEPIGFEVLWSDIKVQNSDGRSLAWAAMACPACGRVHLKKMSIEVSYEYNQSFPGDKIDSYENVSLIRTYPRSDDDVTDIQHLPNGVAEYPQNSRRVLRAKVPSSAAVELRRTVEAAADQFDVKGINLVNQVQEMINRGLITNQFSSALHHVRKIGNQGAHATDAKLTREEVELAGRFVELLLRNLFEVTGELKQIEGKNSDNNDIDTDVDTNTPS